jgi:hypothetical protein
MIGVNVPVTTNGEHASNALVFGKRNEDVEPDDDAAPFGHVRLVGITVAGSKPKTMS